MGSDSSYSDGNLDLTITFASYNYRTGVIFVNFTITAKNTTKITTPTTSLFYANYKADSGLRGSFGGVGGYAVTTHTIEKGTYNLTLGFKTSFYEQGTKPFQPEYIEVEIGVIGTSANDACTLTKANHYVYSNSRNFLDSLIRFLVHFIISNGFNLFMLALLTTELVILGIVVKKLILANR